jgi:hypothetical protein
MRRATRARRKLLSLTLRDAPRSKSVSLLIQGERSKSVSPLIRVAADPAPVRGANGRRASGLERPALAFASEASNDETAVLAECIAQHVALAGKDTSDGDVFGVIIDDVAFDLDVTCSERVGGDGGGDIEEEEGTERRLLVKVRGWGHADADLHEASWSSRAC